MTADDRRAGRAPALVLEPRPIALRRRLWAALFLELHPAFCRAETHPRAGVDDHAQPIEALERVVPPMRLVAVERAQKRIGLCAREHRLHFARQRLRNRRRPLRQESRVNEQPAVFAHHQGKRAQPGKELVAVGRIEDGRQRVVAMRLAMAGGDRQQMQVVIAEHRHRGVAERSNLAQHGERFRSAIDEIADEPQSILVGREADQLEQLTELGVATLDVADGVKTHGFDASSRRARARRRCAADSSIGSCGDSVRDRPRLTHGGRDR